MNYLDILLLIIAWYIFISIVYIITKLRKMTDRVKLYYGLAIIIKGRENVEKILHILSKPLHKIKPRILAICLVTIFIVTMLFLIPVPLLIFPLVSNSKLVIFKYFLYSPVVIIIRNVVLILESSIHHISPMQMLNLGFMSLQPIIPGVTVSLYTFLLIIITAGISILVHEIAHGVVALRYGVPVVSGGFFTSMFILMGGFVEPDEEKLNKLELSKRLAIYSAGVVANILLAILTVIIYLLSKYLTNMFGYPLGVIVTNSKISQIPNNSIILSVNGYAIYNIYDLLNVLSKPEVFNICKLHHIIMLKVLIPGKGLEYVNLNVNNCSTQYLIQYIGLNTISLRYFTVSNTLFYRFLFWLFNLNITLALLNTLPAYPVDGGQVLNAFLSEIISDEKLRQILLYTISIAFWGGLVMTIVYTFKAGLYVIG